MVMHVRCSACAAEEFLPVGSTPGPCRACGSGQETLESVADRRSGADRRSPTRLQRAWDYDPRSWFDRRQA